MLIALIIELENNRKRYIKKSLFLGPVMPTALNNVTELIINCNFFIFSMKGTHPQTKLQGETWNEVSRMNGNL